MTMSVLFSPLVVVGLVLYLTSAVASTEVSNVGGRPRDAAST
jgi:hypothetical protein